MILNKLCTACLLFLLALPTATWAADVSDAENVDQKTSALTSSNRPIVVYASSPTFSIRLAANVSTGYQWFLMDYNPRLVKLIGQQYLTGQTKLTGTPGTSVFKFQLEPVAFKSPQTTRITLEYRRSWEPKAVEQKVFSVMPKPSR